MTNVTISRETKLNEIFHGAALVRPLAHQIYHYILMTNSARLKGNVDFSAFLECVTFNDLDDFLNWYTANHKGVWYENMRGIGKIRAAEIERAWNCMNDNKPFYSDVKIMNRKELEEEVLELRRYKQLYMELKEEK